MGVPVFFKWLCMRNPKILLDAKQPEEQQWSSGNPSIDNFYVDMNGLIHPACNPKGQNIKQPKNFEQQCQNIYEYIDKIMNIVRPRKFLYLAIDGVAPRAKMNQQRSRRFRAAMQHEQGKKVKQQLLQEYKKKLNDVSQIQQYVYKESFNSNVITPGTVFLDNVGKAIREYIKKRMETHKLWKNLIVVFSDASSPGQGQHKIMEFIRQQRASTGYDANQTHCIYGADADLIMLGLATHQPRFYIIRQVVIQAKQKFCTSCCKRGHYFTQCQRATSIQDEARLQQQMNANNINVTFQFINLKMVREYIHVCFQYAKPIFGYNLQRIIDDFVFMCFFVGNDFLPHIPCLSIRQGGIDMLMKVYEYCLSIMPSYIIEYGSICFQSLKIFINQMKNYESDIINQIIFKQNQQKQRQSRDKIIKKQQKDNQVQVIVDLSDPLACFKKEIKTLNPQENNLQNYSVFSHDIFSYKEKYYRQKFRITPSQFLKLKNQISVSYIQALHWICHYYYKGVASWSWYYPFHYSPFFSDINVDFTPSFDMGKPFKPFQQLMAVLPPRSCDAIPQSLRPLMTDINSPLVDYFPNSFEIDLVGKKFAWLGEVLLPFIDDKRLLRAMGDYDNKLSQQQKRLNRLGDIQLFINSSTQIGIKITQNAQKTKQLDAKFQDHRIQGILTFIDRQNSIYRFKIIVPQGRLHNVQLKKDIEYQMIQQLNEDFVRRLDKKAYGGQRFVRIIQRSLGKRKQQIYNQKKIINLQKRNQNKVFYDYQRDRTRQKDRYDKRNDKMDRNYSGDSRRQQKDHRQERSNQRRQYRQSQTYQKKQQNRRQY